jgi:integrase
MSWNAMSIASASMNLSLVVAASQRKPHRVTGSGAPRAIAMATLLLAAGVHPKIVQERLGHSSITMTLDRYSHVSMTMQRDAADVLDTLLTNKARPKRGHGGR